MPTDTLILIIPSKNTNVLLRNRFFTELDVVFSPLANMHASYWVATYRAAS